MAGRVICVALNDCLQLESGLEHYSLRWWSLIPWVQIIGIARSIRSAAFTHLQGLIIMPILKSPSALEQQVSNFKVQTTSYPIIYDDFNVRDRYQKAWLDNYISQNIVGCDYSSMFINLLLKLKFLYEYCCVSSRYITSSYQRMWIVYLHILGCLSGIRTMVLLHQCQCINA